MVRTSILLTHMDTSKLHNLGWVTTTTTTTPTTPTPTSTPPAPTESQSQPDVGSILPLLLLMLTTLILFELAREHVLHPGSELGQSNAFYTDTNNDSHNNTDTNNNNDTNNNYNDTNTLDDAATASATTSQHPVFYAYRGQTTHSI